MLKKRGIRPVVGDRVDVRGVDLVDGRGVVHSVAQRNTLIREPLVANADHALLVLAAADPPFDASQATRFALAAGATGLPVSVLLNKCDLLSPSESIALAERVSGWGYSRVLPASVMARAGLGAVARACRGRTTVVYGPSGVGKSSLTNALLLEGDTLLAGGEEEGEDWEEEEDDDDDGAATFSSSSSVFAYRAPRPPPPPPLSEEDAAVVAASRPAFLRLGGGEFGAASNAPEWRDANPNDPGSALDEPAWFEQRRGSAETERDDDDDDDAAPSAASAPTATAPLLRTAAVSRQTRRGRHTTRSATLVEVPGGGLVADTPGFSLPSLPGLTSTDLPGLFPEISLRLKRGGGRCSFADCSHRHEPGCLIRPDGWDAVGGGWIEGEREREGERGCGTDGDGVDADAPGSSWERYPVYVSLRAELESRERGDAARREGKAQREGTVKLKAAKAIAGEEKEKGKRGRRREGKDRGGDDGDDDDGNEGRIRRGRAPRGGSREEVRLVSKAHRRTSRRSVHQSLDALAGGSIGDIPVDEGE